MTETSSLTLQVPSLTKIKLDRLAGHTHRTPDSLADQALADYLDRELAIVEAIERGRAEIRAGEGLDTDETFRDVEAAIAQVEAASGPR